MESIFKWLQLSDIHFQSKDEGIQTDLLREKLIEYTYNNVNGCNALILSGDFRFAPTGEQNPKRCSDFVLTLAKSLGVENDQIVAVPGNHDLNRSTVRNYLIDGAQSKYNPDIGVIDKSVQTLLMGDFEFYYDLCNSIKGIHALRKDGFPHDIIHLKSCDVLLLNTALMSGKDDESRNLLLGSSNLHKLLTGRRSGLPIIAVGHHSLAELNKDEQRTIESIFDVNGIRLYLCGHAHKPEFRPFGEYGKEITVGCITQDEKDIIATFVEGEISVTGDVIISSYRWDSAVKGWFQDPPRNRMWGRLYMEEEKLGKSSFAITQNICGPLSLVGYSLLGGLGSDGIKYFWKKGGQIIESIAFNTRLKMPIHDEDFHTSAYTVSTSIGCQLAATGNQCLFCGTGARKYGGTLSAKDIALQCIFMAEYDADCSSFPEVKDNSREFAFMGQGEPGLNYPAIRNAIILSDYALEAIGQKVSRYIISTCGITDFMPSLIEDIRAGVFKNPVTVHFSLHEIDARRQELMPINEQYDYREFIKYCKVLYKITGYKIGVGILMFNNYVPVAKNESYTLTTTRLKKILSVLDHNIFRIDLCTVNNSNAGKQQLQRYEEAMKLKRVAFDAGFECKIFTSFGSSLQAGCGMLDSNISEMQITGTETQKHYKNAVKLLNEAETKCFSVKSSTYNDTVLPPLIEEEPNLPIIQTRIGEEPNLPIIQTRIEEEVILAAQLSTGEGKIEIHDSVVETNTIRNVFLSYSWDDKNHQEWVKQLARDLKERFQGITINTILDVNDMVLGDQITHFMEQSIANSDYVIIICTPKYKEKADKRNGGVGYEDSIITGELYNKNNQRKYIPIVARGSWEDSIPTWAKGKLGVDMTTHENYQNGLKKLKETIRRGKM